MNLQIDYSTLSLIDYEGAGNRTPVLNLDSVEHIQQFDVSEVRNFLENNQEFRQWLQIQGRYHKADSVMMYYRSNNFDYEYVTFIGEPGAALDQPFSDMCGNGIRCLALHIFLDNQELQERYLDDGIRIFAGSVRIITFNSVDIEEMTANVTVDLGQFRNDYSNLRQFLCFSEIETIQNIFQKFPFLEKKCSIGIGLNGDQTGEPHLVFLFTEENLQYVIQNLNIIPQENITFNLRKIACRLGNVFTFDINLFPLGINVNIGCVMQDRIYISTHERNMLPSREICMQEQRKHGFCHCNTMACGTGGSVTANVAFNFVLMINSDIKTVHPGGSIMYSVCPETTLMIGPAQRNVLVNEAISETNSTSFPVQQYI